MNDQPYRGRRSDSHKPKKQKKSSGAASFGQTVLAGAIFLALPAGLTLAVAAWLFHGYGVI